MATAAVSPCMTWISVAVIGDGRRYDWVIALRAVETARELGIDENDLWLAAHAALYNLVLVTADRLANLALAIENAGIGPRVEDWTRP